MLEKMKDLIADQLGMEAETITAESKFKEDLGADSLDLFELVMALEDEYSVEIPAEDLQTMATVGDVINYLKNKGIEA
ncbi:MAG: acyl carrier protein [Lachnospiraceae bacterium]|nr:acyl carrier protein [Lachnospiraceae bacterium]MBQ5915394.1 acyl carrier protein [Lachnospiraceae bacterium]